VTEAVAEGEKEAVADEHPSAGSSEASESSAPGPSPPAEHLPALARLHALRGLYPAVASAVGEDVLERLVVATTTRAKQPGGRRVICFDNRHTGRLRSLELLALTNPEAVAPIFSTRGECRSVLDALLALLPAAAGAAQAVRSIRPSELQEVVLQARQRPYATIGTQRVFLTDDPTAVVTAADIRHISARLKSEANSRLFVADRLWRISAMRRPSGPVAGLAIRIAPAVTDAAKLVWDILQQPDTSILVLSPPGMPGRLTMLREMAQITSQWQRVVLLDLSRATAFNASAPCEIGTPCTVALPEGESVRRLMAASIGTHRPDTLIVDQIGQPEEVAATLAAHRRGVRVITSTPGSLRELVRDSGPLRGLLGAFEDTALPDGTLRATRTASAPFRCIVELRAGHPHEWVVVTDVDGAVDALLARRPYKAVRRQPDPQTGLLHSTPITCDP